MQDRGNLRKNVSAAMGVAQAVQAVATLALLALLYNSIGRSGPWRSGPVAGSCSTPYTCSPAAGVIIISQGLHGLAYVVLITRAGMFVDAVRPSHPGFAHR